MVNRADLLLPATLCALAAGIVAGGCLPVPPPVVLYALWAAVAVAAMVLLSRSGRNPAWLPLAALLIAVALLGAARTRARMTPGPNDVSVLIGRPSLWVRGRVEGDVAPGERGNVSFTLAADRFHDFEQGRLVAGYVRVTAYGARPPLPGDTIWVRGRVGEPPPATNPGAFDYRAYLARRGVFSLLTARHDEDLRREPASPRDVPLMARLAHSVRSGVLGAVARNLPREQAALLGGLLLSERAHIPADLDEAFARTGTVHVLSVSGLHLATLAAFLAWAFRLFAAPRRLTALASIALLWVFALAAGGGSAVIRSALMATVVLAAPLARRTPLPPYTLAAAGFLLLLAEPGALFDAGLQLSFATVGALLLLYRPLEAWLLPWEPGMGRLARASRWVLGALLVGVVAQAGSAPLVAYHFNRVSLVAPLANLPVAALTELLLLGGLGASSLSYIFPGVLLAPAWALLGTGLSLLRWLTLAFAAVPFAAFSVASPPVVAVCLYYILLGGAAVALRRVARRRLLFVPTPLAMASPAAPGGGLPSATAARQ